MADDPRQYYRAGIGQRTSCEHGLLGALEGNMKALPEGALERALKVHTAERLQKFVPMNIEALRRGAEYKV